MCHDIIKKHNFPQLSFHDLRFKENNFNLRKPFLSYDRMNYGFFALMKECAFDDKTNNWTPLRNKWFWRWNLQVNNLKQFAIKNSWSSPTRLEAFSFFRIVPILFWACVEFGMGNRVRLLKWAASSDLWSISIWPIKKFPTMRMFFKTSLYS